MWVKSENSEPVKPAALDTTGKRVIVRRGFRLVPATDEKPEHYEYEEWQMTEDAYEVYKSLITLINEQSDALVELAELIAEVV